MERMLDIPEIIQVLEDARDMAHKSYRLHDEMAFNDLIRYFEAQSKCKDDAWDQLSKVYNMCDVPDAAKEIIGDVMLSLH